MPDNAIFVTRSLNLILEIILYLTQKLVLKLPLPLKFYLCKYQAHVEPKKELIKR
jgi:hypothetical protein